VTSRDVLHLTYGKYFNEVGILFSLLPIRKERPMNKCILFALFFTFSSAKGDEFCVVGDFAAVVENAAECPKSVKEKNLIDKTIVSLDSESLKIFRRIYDITSAKKLASSKSFNALPLAFKMEFQESRLKLIRVIEQDDTDYFGDETYIAEFEYDTNKYVRLTFSLRRAHYFWIRLVD
jgi:hypothetical protein